MQNSADAPFDQGTPAPIGAAVPTNRLPGGLKALCIIAIILGILGAIAGTASCVGLVLGEEARAALQPEEEAGTPEEEEFYRQTQAKVNEVARRFKGLNTAVAIMHLGSGVLLVGGGVLTLLRRRFGARLLVIAAVTAIIYEIGGGVANLLIHMYVGPMINAISQEMMPSGGSIEAEGGNLIGPSNFVRIALLASLLLVLVTSLVKIGYYVFLVYYVRKPRIQDYFIAASKGDKSI